MTSATLWIRTTSTGPTGKESSAITAAVILLTASSPGPDQVKHPGMKRSPRAAAEESVKSGTGISCSNADGRTSSPRITHCRPPLSLPFNLCRLGLCRSSILSRRVTVT
jgi:hypothetical protein